MRIFTFIALTLLLMTPLNSQVRLYGVVEDSLNFSPISYARVAIYRSEKVVFTGNKGEFSFDKMPPGIYTIIVSKEGYFSEVQTYNLDSLKNELNVNIYLRPFESVTDTINISGNFYRKYANINTSYINAGYEEMRKAPGALEDVIKYFASSPGVSIGNDISNELIVRGGSPVENLTLIDGLEIQNPNHYGAPGSTNGILSYINLKLVREVDFFSGGFPPKYGDRLSGVMDIKFKDGNRKKHIRDLNISATGAGGFFEGPITSRSSYMFSARRSYLELIKKYLLIPLIPNYWDFNGKISYDLSRKDKISLLGLFAIDNAGPHEEGDYMYDTINVKILSVGINYSKTGKKFDVRMIFGYNWNFYKVNFLSLENFLLDINDNMISFKQELDYKLNKNFVVNVFTSGNYFFSKYRVKHDAGYNASNYYTPAVSFDNNVNTYKLACGFNITSTFLKNKLTLNAGLRFDNFELINDKLSISPRVGLSYQLTPVTTINANAGIHFQSPEILWVLVDPNNRNLDYIRVDELVLGLEHLFSSDLKISVEPYLKQYYNYPVSVYDPNFIFINSGVEIYPNFLDMALSSGKGYFTGVDVTFQKKNPSNGFYWTMAYSFTKSKFLALAGDIQPAQFDYGNQITAIAGYKFKFGLGISSRFKYAKGRPYTPFDMDKSYEYGRGIYDKSMYNKANMPDYCRLDVRVDQQLNIGDTKLSVYIEIINLLNRTNYYIYRWSYYNDKVMGEYQITRVPILGLSYQF